VLQVAVQAFCCGSTACRHPQGKPARIPAVGLQELVLYGMERCQQALSKPSQACPVVSCAGLGSLQALLFDVLVTYLSCLSLRACCCADVGEAQDQADPEADLCATTACPELAGSCSSSGSSSGCPGTDSCSNRRSSAKGSPCRSSLHPLQHATTRMPALQGELSTCSSTEPCRRSSCCSPASEAATCLAGRLDAATKHCTGPEAPQQALQADLCQAASSGGVPGSAAPVHAAQAVACMPETAAAELHVPEVSTAAACSAVPGIEPTSATTEPIAALETTAHEAAAAAQPAAAVAPSAEDAAVARAAAAEATQQVLCCAEQEADSDVCCRVSVKQSKALRVSFAPLPPSKDLWLQQLRSMPPEGKARFMRKLQLVGRKAWCMWRRRSRTPAEEQQQQQEERHGLKRDWQRAASESSSDEDELLQGSPCKKALAPGLLAAGDGPEPKADRSGFSSPVAGVSAWRRDAAVGSPQPMVLG